VPDGYAVDVLLKWGDEFGDGLRFGYNCDYATWFPVEGRTDDVLLWVSHEYVIPFFTSDWDRSADATWDPRGRHRELMEREKKEVGGSIVELRRERNGRWQVVERSRYARRFYGDAPPIPYDGPVAGTSLAPSGGTVLGTLANCSGARTPWGTVLSCEENHQSYGLRRLMPFQLGWIKGAGATREEVNYYVGEPGVNVDGQRVGDEWPFNGYVVEIDPFTGRAVKHSALGGSTTRTSPSASPATAASSRTRATTRRTRTGCSSSSSRGSATGAACRGATACGCSPTVSSTSRSGFRRPTIRVSTPAPAGGSRWR
jgi:secreted PhoX family phosphatase